MAEEHSIDSGKVRSVQRAMEILSLLTETHPSVTIREIVDRTGLAKTTVIRLVQTLEQNGLLWATSRGYTAGPGLWRWAHLAQRSWEVPPETRNLMRELAATYRETVNLYMTRDLNRVCVAQEEGPQALRHVVRVGDELPMWAGASSKVLLRDANSALLARVAAVSPWGREHADTLRTWVDEAAARGFATSAGEREPGLSAVAVPITGRSASVVAALCLSGPTLRFTPDRVAEFVEALQHAAAQLNEKGFDHPLAG
ncbi:IclR family transcriptional regulator [Asanoa sp. NPDC049573]|uniref:IclR family transcriptional regulator n=1 Tax=Asanoa sp. NPDC049573 TaxID=3155396 RepID=UPI00343F8012